MKTERAVEALCNFLFPKEWTFKRESFYGFVLSKMTSHPFNRNSFSSWSKSDRRPHFYLFIFFFLRTLGNRKPRVDGFCRVFCHGFDFRNSLKLNVCTYLEHPCIHKYWHWQWILIPKGLWYFTKARFCDRIDRSFNEGSLNPYGFVLTVIFCTRW